MALQAMASVTAVRIETSSPICVCTYISLSLYLSIYIYIYIHIHIPAYPIHMYIMKIKRNIYIYIYIHRYIDRERYIELAFFLLPLRCSSLEIVRIICFIYISTYSLSILFLSYFYVLLDRDQLASEWSTGGSCYTRKLLGWLGTRLAQDSLNCLSIAELTLNN